VREVPGRALVVGLVDGDVEAGVADGVVGGGEAAATNGPSVVSVLPSCIRTVVAISAGCSRRPGLTPGVSAITL
jgi:hypothetical protein